MYRNRSFTPKLKEKQNIIIKSARLNIKAYYTVVKMKNKWSVERINLFWIKLFYILVLYASLFLLLHLITIMTLKMEIKPTMKLQAGFCSVR